MARTPPPPLTLRPDLDVPVRLALRVLDVFEADESSPDEWETALQVVAALLPIRTGQRRLHLQKEREFLGPGDTTEIRPLIP